MKRKYALLLTAFSLSIITLSSCNQTWNCECSAGGKVIQVTPIQSLGKMGAKRVCDSYERENNRTLGTNQSCKIK
ncbi:MAG: hypothetical protein RJA25_951 [Bacteroidota bacterium]|jgi:hypothetical protein